MIYLSEEDLSKNLVLTFNLKTEAHVDTNVIINYLKYVIISHSGSPLPLSPLRTTNWLYSSQLSLGKMKILACLQTLHYIIAPQSSLHWVSHPSNLINNPNISTQPLIGRKQQKYI